jgi:hypothetical protein
MIAPGDSGVKMINRFDSMRTKLKHLDYKIRKHVMKKLKPRQNDPA